jgi:hypothetical protein
MVTASAGHRLTELAGPMTIRNGEETMARKKALKALTASGGASVVVERVSRQHKPLSHEEMAAVKLQQLYEPTLENQFLTAAFSQEIEKQLNTVYDLERLVWYNARKGMALEILTATRDFLSLLVDLFMIRRAFDISSRKSLEGVAPILGVAKATVQNQLKSLGLDSNTIRDPVRSMGDLIKLSEPLQTLMDRLLELHERYSNEINALPKPPSG